MEIKIGFENVLFPKWGLPRIIRVDNGQPFADTKRSMIPVLSLWLIGLGIIVHCNRPGIPQENAKVERNQGTTAKWSDYKKCRNLHILEKSLEETCIIQREKYPLARNANKTRKQLFPELYNNERRYQTSIFNINLVFEHLRKGSFVRKVSKSNQFTFYGLQPSIPKGYAHQDIIIQLDTKQNFWHVYNRDGIEITHIPNNFITNENINNLTICQRTKLNI